MKQSSFLEERKSGFLPTLVSWLRLYWNVHLKHLTTSLVQLPQ